MPALRDSLNRVAGFPGSTAGSRRFGGDCAALPHPGSWFWPRDRAQLDGNCGDNRNHGGDLERPGVTARDVEDAAGDERTNSQTRAHRRVHDAHEGPVTFQTEQFIDKYGQYHGRRRDRERAGDAKEGKPYNLARADRGDHLERVTPKPTYRADPVPHAITQI